MSRPFVPLILIGLVASCGTPSPQDIVLVTLDTFRADRMGAYGHPGNLTPHLDRLAARGVLFEDASAVTPITLPSHASILTGRYPTTTGVRNNGTFVLPRSETTIAETLRERGFATGAVIAAFPLQSRYGLAQGFDVYDDTLPPTRVAPGEPLPVFFSERDARAVTDRALEVWARLAGRPRFLWVHYFDAHAPYAPPEPWRTTHREASYDGEIAYLDHELGRLLDRVASDSPEAVVAVIGDHGESLGDHGEKTHGVFVYQSTIHVPFVLVAPGRLPAARRIAAPVSQVDLAPTLLGLLGVTPPGGIEGADLRELVASGRGASRPVYAESLLPRLQFRFAELTSLRRGPLKLIDAPERELYDVRQDPGEERNLAGGHPEEESLVTDLRDFLEGADPEAGTRAAGALDAESEARLRSLGYAAVPQTVSRSRTPGRDPKSMTDYLRRYDRAVGLASEGRHEEAVALLREILPEAPENVMIRYQLAASFFGARRFADALAELEPLIEAEPDFANAQLMRAELLARLGRVDEAVGAYTAAAAGAPQLAAPHLGIGRLLESVGRFEEAATAYRRALDLEPDDREIASRLIALRAGRGDLAKAVDELTAMVDRRGDSAGLWGALATALQRQGNRPAARGAVSRGLEINPNRPDLWLLRGDLLLDDGEPSSALTAYDRALEAGAERLDVLLGRARAHLALGRTVEADAALSEANRFDPRSAVAANLRGLYFERLGDDVSALAAYRRALSLNPGDEVARDGIARLRGRRNGP